MELLGYPKSEYLLNAPLESLHNESAAWLHELGFWADEMAFFYRLLHEKKFSAEFPTTEIAEIEKTLVRLNGEDLQKVKAQLTAHERLLATAFQSPSLADEQGYRLQHQTLHHDMTTLQQQIRNFKKSLFSFVRK